MSNPAPNKNIPGIPEPSADVGSLARVVQALRQAVESLGGYRGNALGRATTFYDLINLGLVTELAVLSGGETGLAQQSSVTTQVNQAVPPINDGYLFANITGATHTPSGVSFTSFLDHDIGTGVGSVVYRTNVGWAGATLAAVALSGSASDLTVGTLPNARLSAVPNSALANSSITLSSHAVALGGSYNIVSGDVTGTTTNDDAAAGVLGEYHSASVASGAALGLTSGTPLNVASLNLTAGDWEVSGSVGFAPAGATTTSDQQAAISTTSATIPSLSAVSAVARLPAACPAGVGAILPTGVCRITLAATTTVYLVAQATFATSTNAAYGFIRARRVR